jgi:hypothetical protein
MTGPDPRAPITFGSGSTTLNIACQSPSISLREICADIWLQHDGGGRGKFRKLHQLGRVFQKKTKGNFTINSALVFNAFMDPPGFRMDLHHFGKLDPDPY